MFSLLHAGCGNKVDFRMLTDEPFDLARFGRRRQEHALGMTLFVSTPEDTGLAKLHWARLSGGSEKQFHDVVRVYQVQFASLDLEYLEKWVNILRLEDEWARVLKEAAVE